MRSITAKAICTLVILALMAGGVYWAAVTPWTPFPDDTSSSPLPDPSTSVSQPSSSTVPGSSSATIPSAPHSHVFMPGWEFDEEVHWHACDCGERANVNPHSDDDLDAKCDICDTDVPLPPHEHNFGTVWESDDSNHWNACLCGERINLTPHSDADMGGKCDICGADVPLQPHEHSFGTVWGSDDTNHWNFCECGELSNVAAHSDTDVNGKCDVCSADVPLPPHEHSFGTDWVSNEDSHWHVCQCGEKTNAAPHIDANINGKCDICNADVPLPPHEHSFGTIWKSDDSSHWNACLCGEKANTAAHIDANVNGKCDICNANVPLPPHVHDFGTDWLSNDTTHWQVCDCGEKSSPVSHADRNGDHRCDVCKYVVSLPDAPSLKGKHAFIFDCEENDYFFSSAQSPSQTVYPASITKLFTCYVALQYLTDLSEMITLGAEQELVPYDASIVRIDEGDKVSVDFLLHGTLMESGSDAAYGLAAAAGYRILGNTNASAKEAVDAFLKRMNELAIGLGMGATNFVTPDGIHSSEHAISFHAFVTIARCAMANDTIRSICGKAETTMDYIGASGRILSAVFTNTNALLHPGSGYYIPQAVGLKTGYTQAAGHCFLGLFIHNGQCVIIATFGCSSSSARWQDMVALWNYYVELKALKE